MSASATTPASFRPATQKPLRRPTSAAPVWLGDENPEWRGNFRVRFWDPAWQSEIVGRPGAALDRLIADGFDGVYLDRADVWTHWLGERASSKADMIALVQRISDTARARAPGFVVIMQNAEELVGTRRLRQAIDAIAKEDLLYGVDGTGRRNATADVEASLELLRKARKAGLPVLVVEYLNDPAHVAEAGRQLAAEGFVATFARRELDALPTYGADAAGHNSGR